MRYYVVYSMGTFDSLFLQKSNGLKKTCTQRLYKIHLHIAIRLIENRSVKISAVKLVAWRDNSFKYISFCLNPAISTHPLLRY